jgi:hypothetical protein
MVRHRGLPSAIERAQAAAVTKARDVGGAATTAMHSAFNYSVGCATIILLMLSVSPYFPRYKTHIRYAAVFLLGALVGSVYASVFAPPTVYQLHFGFSPMLVLGAALLAVIILALVLWLVSG